MTKQIHIIISILACISTLTISSCQDNNHSENIISKEITLMSSDTLNIRDISINVDKTLIRKYILLNDSIAIIVKHPKSGNFIDVFDIKEGKNISSYFKVGEGPDEMIFCDVSSDGHDLIATDFVRSRFVQFPIDSLINPSFKPSFITYPFDIGITSHPIKVMDSIIIVNPFHYTNIRYKINQNVPRLLFVSSNQKISNIMDGVNLFTQNVGQANILRNPQTGEIWVIPLGKSVIEIYDSQLVHRKNIIIPSDVMGDAEISIRSTPSGEKVCYKGGYPLAFTSSIISPNKQYVYICFVGKFIGAKEKENNYSTKILAMNWTGDLIKSYFCPKYIYSLSEFNSKLYATIEDDDENRCLVQLCNE